MFKPILFILECEKEKARVYAVDTHAIMMKEQYGKMIPQFGQDSLMVFTTHKCPLPKHISQLTKVKNEQPDCVSVLFEVPFSTLLQKSNQGNQGYIQKMLKKNEYSLKYIIV